LVSPIKISININVEPAEKMERETNNSYMPSVKEIDAVYQIPTHDDLMGSITQNSPAIRYELQA
jgi:hypothetical protein